MDPFGDNSDSGDLNAFQPPADASSYSNDFYEVDSGEAPTDAAPADSFSFGDNDDAPAAAAPVQHDDMDLNASYSQDDFASSSGSRTTSFEHQQTSHSASHSANHSASNSRHSSFQAAASASGGSRTSSFGQSGAGASSIPVVEEENELTKFMREYEQRIADKAQEQAKVALESKDKAQSDMAQFVNERSRIKESKQQANRVHEQATLEKLAADLEAENPWERVVSLVELEANRKQKLAALQAASSSKSKDANAEPPKATKKSSSNDDDEDVSRMRQLFVQLKAEPLEQTRGAIATH